MSRRLSFVCQDGLVCIVEERTAMVRAIFLVVYYKVLVIDWLFRCVEHYAECWRISVTRKKTRKFRCVESKVVHSNGYVLVE